MAQAPQSFKYQAVARDVNGNIITYQNVGIRIRILQGSASGTVVYTETFSPTTNEFGLVKLNIGLGNVVTGSFASIDWADGIYFIEVSMDINGGANYQIYGTSQLMSVPYALHSKTAENVELTETDPVFSNSVAGGITQEDTSDWNRGIESYTETDPVFNNSVASGITEEDTSAWNKGIESYTETDPVFTASPANGILPDDITNWNTAYSWGDHSTAGYLTSEVDGSTTNEIQDLSLTGNTLSITGDISGVDLSQYLDDQTVSITQGTGILVSGTYPNFSIDNTMPFSNNELAGEVWAITWYWDGGSGGTNITYFPDNTASSSSGSQYNWALMGNFYYHSIPSGGTTYIGTMVDESNMIGIMVSGTNYNQTGHWISTKTVLKDIEFDSTIDENGNPIK